MRRAAKVDDNQSEIVSALRDIGCSVQTLAAVGKGVPDLLVGYRGINWLMEIKDGAKTKSQQKLTDDQVKWHSSWLGEVYVINSVDAAISLVTKRAS